jgi:hypothetical protein
MVVAAGKTVRSILSLASVFHLSAYISPVHRAKFAFASAQSAVYNTVRSYTSSRMRIERDGSTSTITYHPNEGSHSATVVLMHGLGDSADGLSDLAEQWGQQLPHVKFILPSAVPRAVTLNGGMRMNAWYDIFCKECRW